MSLGRSSFVAVLLLGAALGCGDSGSDPVAPDPDPVPGPGASLPPLAAGDYVLVLNRESRDVSVLSAAQSYAEVRRLALPDVGAAPAGFDVDPGTGTLYVSFPNSQTTIVAIGLDGVERARAQVSGWGPDLAVDAGRGLVVVATGTGVEFLASSSLASRARVQTGTGRTGAWDVTVDPTWGLTLVSNSFDDQVVGISTSDFRIQTRSAVDAYPRGSAVVEGVAFVAANDADRLDAVSLADGSLLASIPTGNGPTSVVADPSRGRVYVANDLSGEISVVDAATRSELGRWALHHGLPDIALSADGSRLFTCQPSGALVEIRDAATGAELAEVAVGRSPDVLRAVTLP
ncbi:MAG TPA: hypothetical protein VIC59_06045 [Gemmatimonadota bacterium]